MDTFAVLGGDLRCIYLAKLLADDGYPVVAAGFDQTELPDVQKSRRPRPWPTVSSCRCPSPPTEPP